MSNPSAHIPMGRNRRRAITAGLLLGMSLGALEATVVGTAMPTIISTLGGLAHYSWVFSAYLLTSTATVPIWGRLSDLYGRRRNYLIGIVIFLAGSVLAGAADSMPMLIAARAVQGLGTGAIIPLSMTIIGELYTLSERARVQALFSGVWGLASIAGPLVGGYITDFWSWRWVFYINLPFGLLGILVIALAYPPMPSLGKARVDWTGAASLFAGISALLIALGGEGGLLWPWLVASVMLLALFVVAERRAAEPILPLDLFGSPVISRTLVVVFLVGFSLFGAIAFIPLYVQAIMRGSATAAGQVLTPLFLGWVTMSIVGARATVLLGYRVVSITGSALMTLGFVGLMLLPLDTTNAQIYAACTVLGAGMGMQMLSLLLAVQHGVDRSRLGIATSLNQFSRSIGAAVGVAVMGALLTRGLPGVPLQRGSGGAGTAESLKLTEPERRQFAAALHQVFVAGGIVAGAGLIAALFLPPVDFARGVRGEAGEQMLTAEMANLKPEDEPVAIPD
jgi:EmrB/QacA subfamily drug resistance transporter